MQKTIKCLLYISNVLLITFVFSGQAVIDRTHETQYRLELIKDMTRKAWKAYSKYAWGEDSLKPLEKRSHEGSFGRNSGRSILASMSTLWVTGLRQEFEQGERWIDEKFNFSNIDANRGKLFNEVVEFMGGLLSLYALTGRESYLRKAKEVAMNLEDAYSTETGLPFRYYNPKTKKRLYEVSWLSDIGGQYLEHAYLSDLTPQDGGRQRAIVNRIRQHLKAAKRANGLYLDHLQVDGRWSSLWSSLSSMSREFFANLLKSYLQSDGQNEEAMEMYFDAVSAMVTSGMLHVGGGGEEEVCARSYCPEEVEDERQYSLFMEYGDCYLGAMLSLGAKAMRARLFTGDETKRQTYLREAQRHLKLAVKLTETCHRASNQTSSCLGPDIFYVQKLKVLNGNYFLSPELAESYFVLWRLTRERKYQEYAWEMAKAIYRYCQTGSGFAGLEDVNNITSIWIDHQPPIFLSATLKYIYLTFSSESVLPLDQWVFNSVGHPLPICGRQNTYPAQLCITNV